MSKHDHLIGKKVIGLPEANKHYRITTSGTEWIIAREDEIDFFLCEPENYTPDTVDGIPVDIDGFWERFALCDASNHLQTHQLRKAED